MKPILIKNLSSDLDCVVEQLIDCHNNGINAYAIFNGHYLYSSNIDLDSAYIQVYGMSKEEYMKKYLEMKKNHYYEWTKNNIKPELQEEWRKFINKNLTTEYDKYDKSIIKAKYLADAFSSLKDNPIKLERTVQIECPNLDVLYLVSYIIECFFKDTYELSLFLKEIISKRNNNNRNTSQANNRHVSSKSLHPMKRLVLMKNKAPNIRRTY